MENRKLCVFVCLCIFVIMFYSLSVYYNPSQYTNRDNSIMGNNSKFLNRFFTSLKYVALQHVAEYVDLKMSACPNLPVPNLNRYEDLWQLVSNSKQIFLYSAFVDGDTIRLIAIRQRTVAVLTCQIWCRNTSLNTVFVKTFAARLEKISGGENGQSYTTTYVVCPLPRSGVPYAVSIAEGNLTCQPAKNSFLLQTSKKVKQGNFSVCIPPVYGTYPTPHHLIQWIETNRLLGAQFFTFYNATINPNSVLWEVFQKYVKEHIIEVLPWNIPTHDIHYVGQIASMHDCLYRNSRKFNYTAFIDLDELIIPRIPEDMTWSDMFKRLPDGCSYSFQSSFFQYNSTNISYNKPSSDLLFNKSFVVSGVKREKQIFPHSVRSKVIVKPDEIKTFGVHITWSCKSGKVIRHVDTAIGMLHHYRHNKKTTDVSDKTTLKYLVGLRKQLEKSPSV